MADLPQSKAGTKITIDVTGEYMVVKPAIQEKSKFHFPYTEAELLAEITPEKAHADEVAQSAGLEIGD